MAVVPYISYGVKMKRITILFWFFLVGLASMGNASSINRPWWSESGTGIIALDADSLGFVNASGDTVWITSATGGSGGGLDSAQIMDVVQDSISGDITLSAASVVAITAQSIVGNDVDSIGENFVFDDAYRGTSAVSDSQYVTKGYADAFTELDPALDAATVTIGDGSGVVNLAFDGTSTTDGGIYWNVSGTRMDVRGSNFLIGKFKNALTDDVHLSFGATNTELLTWDGDGTDDFILSDILRADGLIASGTVEGATITEGGVAVYNDNEMDAFSEIDAIVADKSLINLEDGGTFTGNVIANANLSVGNAGTTAGVLTLLEDDDDGSNFASFMAPALTANTVYTLPADDGDNTEVLQTNGSGTLSWVANAGSGSAVWVQSNDSSVLVDADDGDTTMIQTDDNLGAVTWGIGALQTSLTIDGGGSELRVDDPLHVEGDIWVNKDSTNGDALITFNDGDTDGIIHLDDILNLFESNIGWNIVGNIAVSGTVDGKDIATNAAMINEAEVIASNWDNTANPWADNEVADDITIDFADDVDTTGTEIAAALADRANIHDTLTISFVIQGIDEDHDFPFRMFPKAITLIAVSGHCLEGEDVDGCLMEYNGDAESPTACNSSDWTFTDGEERTTSISNASIDAGDYLGWKTEDVDGDVDFFTLTIEYTVN